MAAGKSGKLDFSSPGSGGTKRQKPDLPSPQKAAGPREHMDAMQELLTEIRAVRGLVEANKETLSGVQADIVELKEMKEQLMGLAEKISRVESQVECHEERLKLTLVNNKRIALLERNLEDLNNRTRRNNVRIIGVPEGAEAGNMLAFLSAQLPKLLRLDFSPPLEFERAHRVPLHPGPHAKQPRPIILRVLRHQQALQIMSAAKSLVPISFEGRNISFFPDFSKGTVERRRQMLALRPRLQHLQARYGLFAPACFWVTLHNQTRTFEDPQLLLQFVEEQEAMLMR